ncbi:peptide MFS transporter [Marinibactrum halimedae]|uniref:MFS transporter n=1 Tax=Marinibactrum halimedae TaxID=1444977 RepID=A0AA37T639_9GAMM|nr:peptide MFS transporter [Marinibactrum halimedae]MCD9459227.1 peptide MFS transporter [Marinibactrum halimedae]GLS27299.1 MFS transporter [Marinibactrum halimedae]
MSTSTFFGHPKGLSTLFFLEMWERVSYYGMRALLILFMVAAIADGGLAIDDATATAIYGLYTASVYLLSMPGGWIADRLLGAQRSVFAGGCVIAAGHFVLAIPATETFFIGLFLVAMGTGLLKPNVSTIVGQLYSEEDQRRDSGYTIFYMGINIGGMLGPIICGFLGESDSFGWHWGFGVAGVGMVLGLIQYHFGRKHLGSSGLTPTPGALNTKVAWNWVFGLSGALTLVFLLGVFGVIAVSAVSLAAYGAQLIALLFVVYFLYLILLGGLTSLEKRRAWVVFILCVGCAIFWSGFEQTGSSFNLFASRYTDRTLDFIDFEIPASWFQSINSLFIILTAPFVAWLWFILAKRNLDPSSPVKFAFGLLLLAAGFFVMVLAAKLVSGGEKVLPFWLVLTYFLHTLGELCLSPVGMSAVSRLAPARYASQMMGMWFLAISFGNIFAGLLAGRFDPNELSDMPGLYLQIALMGVGAAVILLALAKPLSRWEKSVPEKGDDSQMASSSAS